MTEFINYNSSFKTGALVPDSSQIQLYHHYAHTNEEDYHLPVVKKKMQTDPLDLSMKTLSRNQSLSLDSLHQNQQSSDTSSSSLPDDQDGDGDSELIIVCEDDHGLSQSVVVVGVDVNDDNEIQQQRKSRDTIIVERLFKSKRHMCFMCNYDCKSEVALQKHTSRMHSVKTNNGRVRCAVCGGSFESFEQLHSHQTSNHSDKEDKKLAFYSCNHCKKQFRSEKQLAAHRRLLDKKNSWKEGVGKDVSAASNSKKSKGKSKSPQNQKSKKSPPAESLTPSSTD